MWPDDNPTLSRKGRVAISEWKNLVSISAVVIWDIMIEQALGKLEFPSNFRAVLGDQPFKALYSTINHACAIGALLAHHRDPFNRMLVGQAKVEDLTLVTHDTKLKKIWH